MCARELLLPTFTSRGPPVLSTSPTRLFRRSLVLLSLASFYGCTDEAPTTPTLRADASPARSLALAAPVVVTNTDDAGPGSLRQTIIDAPDGATIQFDAAIAGKTIVLSTGSLNIDKTLTVEGPVPAGMTISGGLLTRVFWIQATGNAILRNLSIIDGRDKFGGGLWVEGTAILDHSLVANNEAREADGGGILLVFAAELGLINSTLSGNTSPRQGGGIYSLGRISIRNSTIAANVAYDGGGIYLEKGSVSMRNSIMAGNTGLAGVADNCSSNNVFIVFSGRNISTDETCGDEEAYLVTDPHLGPLTSNGGPTKTHGLPAPSPAIDAGTSCTEATDQRYVPRNQGSSCDIGAFEFNDYRTITLTLDPNASVNVKTGVAIVTGTIKCSATTAVAFDVTMSQTQKTTGRFTEIVQAQGNVSVPACGTTLSSWSVALTPASGKFEPGAATATASTATVPAGFLPAKVSAPLRLFQVK